MITKDDKTLYCRACGKTVCCEVLQQLNPNLHKDNIKIKSIKSAPVQKLLSKFPNNSFLYFSFDLCEAFFAAYIPLWKLTGPTLRNVIEKYAQCKVPDKFTVRKNYVKRCYDLIIEILEIKFKIILGG
jgi:hypothetical protein